VAGPSTPLTCGAEGGTAAAPDEYLQNNLNLGKYAKENLKNINVDAKNYDDDFV
jgi:hypothetical protein